MMIYMERRVKKLFISIVGDSRASDQPEDLAVYGMDPHLEEKRPDLVLFPISTDEVSRILRLAFQEKIPVTPRGSGTNLAGEVVPIRGGIVMSLTKMNRILDLDIKNSLVRVEPGVLNYDLQMAVEEHGLMYPPDPSSWKIATMGGTVATNAGGPRTLKYGVTRDYLLGLTVILANGNVLKTGGSTLKNVTGYDLTRLFCGSEGPLGVMTEITARLVPKPEHRNTLVADFVSLADSSQAVIAIKKAGIVPAALELMDNAVIKLVETHAKLGLSTDVAAMLLVEVDGCREAVSAEIDRIESILKEHHVVRLNRSKSLEEAESLWTARRSAFSAMARQRPNVLIEDVTVPVSQLTTMIQKVGVIAQDTKVEIGIVAHAGDGNLHPFIMFDHENKGEVSRVEKAIDRIFREALSLGGTLSGENGIGLAKKKFLSLELDEVALKVTRDLKKALDPDNILNPGKFAE